ncbi:MAG: hypothetical protein KatS3mg076_0507 [Candidatus Binatia bacterium]|nr:MAG: hypothetical protein KatS3mg076_0507 [Candidatus Binatia bacterium]
MCVGDCNEDDVVRITEVQTCINIAAGTAPLSTCPNCDQDGSGTVDSIDLGATVDSFLSDAATCPQVVAPPTPTPGGGLGVRVFTIAPKPSQSGFFTSVVPIDVSQNPFVGEIRLVAGDPGPDGVAPISVAEDTTIGWAVLDNSAVCIRIFAAGSSGTIDCDGGTPHGVRLTLDSNGSGPGETPVAETGLGAPVGPGSASFTAMVAVVNVPPVPPDFNPANAVAQCDTVDFSSVPAVLTPFTTATATARIEEPHPSSTGITGGVLQVQRTGVPFSCDTWTDSDSAGVLVLPVLGEDQVPQDLGGGDVASVGVLDD